MLTGAGRSGSGCGIDSSGVDVRQFMRTIINSKKECANMLVASPDSPR
jgi:hypothetical protein